MGAQNLNDRIKTLSEREKEVLDELIQGKTNRQIAERLDVTERSVQVHVGRILFKTRAPNRLALVVSIYENLLNGAKQKGRK